MTPILSEAPTTGKPLPSNLLLLLFWATWVQQARIARLEQLNCALAAEIDRLRPEEKRAA